VKASRNVIALMTTTVELVGIFSGYAIKMLKNIVRSETMTPIMSVVRKLFLNCEAIKVGKMISELTSKAPTILTPITITKALNVDKV
jgi:hypothetical protein